MSLWRPVTRGLRVLGNRLRADQEIADEVSHPGFSRNSYTDARIAPRLRLLKDFLVGEVGDTLWVLMGTVGIVLAIARANVANLLLVRVEGRRQELAIRIALGAGRMRVARQMLLESGLLGIAGAAIGLALAYAALRVLVASGLTHLPRPQEISVDMRVAAFALAIALVSSLLSGLIPALKYTRPHLTGGLRSGGRSLAGSKEEHRARSLLVVTQVALSLVLLIGSGLMIRTFRALRQVDPGFSGAEQVETVRIGILSTQVNDPEQVLRMEEEILHKMEAVAGVSRVAMINQVPLQGGSTNPVFAEDHSYADGAIPSLRRFKFVSPGYISTIGSRLIAGRDLTWAEMYGRALWSPRIWRASCGTIPMPRLASASALP